MQVILQLQSLLLRGVHPLDAIPLWLQRMVTCYHPMTTTHAGARDAVGLDKSHARWHGSEGY